MNGVNKVILLGNLGADPETKNVNESTKVTRFNIATSESYKNAKGERVEDTQWHTIVTWNKLAEICEKYLKKGTTVYIEGKIETRSYTDKEGVKKYTTEIIADSVNIISKQV